MLEADVVSTAIRHVRYNTIERILTITFIQGADYDYYDVPEEEYYNLIKAPSIGKYFNKYIKSYAAPKI